MNAKEQRAAYRLELELMGIKDMATLSAQKSKNRRVHEIYHAMIHINAEIVGAYIGYDPDSDRCKDCKIWEKK
jgi:hypothetical protein